MPTALRPRSFFAARSQDKKSNKPTTQLQTRFFTSGVFFGLSAGYGL